MVRNSRRRQFERVIQVTSRTGRVGALTSLPFHKFIEPTFVRLQECTHCAYTDTILAIISTIRLGLGCKVHECSRDTGQSFWLFHFMFTKVRVGIWSTMEVGRSRLMSRRSTHASRDRRTAPPSTCPSSHDRSLMLNRRHGLESGQFLVFVVVTTIIGRRVDEFFLVCLTGSTVDGVEATRNRRRFVLKVTGRSSDVATLFMPCHPRQETMAGTSGDTLDDQPSAGPQILRLVGVFFLSISISHDEIKIHRAAVQPFRKYDCLLDLEQLRRRPEQVQRLKSSTTSPFIQYVGRHPYCFLLKYIVLVVVFGIDTDRGLLLHLPKSFVRSFVRSMNVTVKSHGSGRFCSFSRISKD
mmetsp:Transcript_8597/g.21542  ORF Transcript_8597/g.21542 Transcript_8597/m.21542 type:complete len:354 (-) Transcript_8597:533-1594(-)